MNPSKTKIVFALRHAERNLTIGGLTTKGKDQAFKIGQKIFKQISDFGLCIVIVSELDHGIQTGVYIFEALKGTLRRTTKINVEPRFSFDSCDDGESQANLIASLAHNFEVCIVVGHGSAPVGIARKYAQDMSLPPIEDKEPVFGSGYKIDIEKRTIERFHLDDDLVSAP